MIKQYIETRQSKLLYSLNQRNQIFLKRPELLKPNGVLEYIWKYIYILFRKLHRYILSRNLYDIKKENNDYEYDRVEEIKYNGDLPKIAIYTCITGKYDYLYEPLYNSKYIDYFNVTDLNMPKTSLWRKIDINKIDKITHLDNIRKARYIKLHPQEVLQGYDYSIWVDGNIIVNADLMPLVLEMIKSQKTFGCHMHPHRNKLSTESKAIKALRRTVNIETMKKQVNKYYEDGYQDENKILETTILIRKHNDDQVKKLMEAWWKQICVYTTRDQISLPYAMWKEKWDLSDIFILGNNLKLNPRFIYMGHK